MNKFGLTTEEASKALSEQGNNALTQPPRETFWDKLWENFKDHIIPDPDPGAAGQRSFCLYGAR